MNLASPKLGGKQNTFVLLPSGHGGSRTLILHYTDTVVDAGALPFRATCPVILFRTTGWLNHVRGGRTPFTDLGDQCFRGRTNPDHQEKG